MNKSSKVRLLVIIIMYTIKAAEIAQAGRTNANMELVYDEFLLSPLSL